jgi:hypothetical protein
LRQDFYLVNTKLRFERRSDTKALRMAAKLLDLETVATLTTPRN